MCWYKQVANKLSHNYQTAKSKSQVRAQDASASILKLESYLKSSFPSITWLLDTTNWYKQCSKWQERKKLKQETTQEKQKHQFFFLKQNHLEKTTPWPTYLFQIYRNCKTMAIVQWWVLNPFDQAIDISTSDGHKIYKDGIKLLDNKFDGTPDKATFFQTKVIDMSESRFWVAVTANWNSTAKT